MNISVGIPVYDSKLQMQSVLALLAEVSLASRLGHSLTVRFLPSCTNLALGRNQLVKEFLESKDEKLIFLDADVTFEPGDLLKLAHYPVDLVGGAYRLKLSDEKYPVGWLDKKELWCDENGLLEVAMIPTGFMCLSRKVFETFKEKRPNREYEIQGNKVYCFFQIPYWGGQLFTEDAYFCHEWKALGGKIYLDPMLTLTHWEFNKPFTGNIGKFLKSRVPEKTLEAQA